MTDSNDRRPVILFQMLLAGTRLPYVDVNDFCELVRSPVAIVPPTRGQIAG